MLIEWMSDNPIFIVNVEQIFFAFLTKDIYIFLFLMYVSFGDEGEKTNWNATIGLYKT